MIRSLSNVALAFALVVGSNQALAKCADFGPAPGAIDPVKAAVKGAVSMSTAVFIGTVTAIEYVPAHSERIGDAEMQVIRMATDSWWKGMETPQITLHTSHYRRSDGLVSEESHERHYEVGKKYLVYARTFSDGLRANICTRTKPIESAASDILLLDALKAE